jgi:hypothetical protein
LCFFRFAIVWTFYVVELCRKLYRELLKLLLRPASRQSARHQHGAARTGRGKLLPSPPNIVLPLNAAGVVTSAQLVFGKVRGKVESAKCPNSRLS